ncbi:MAG: class I SAM-dependent methyltransferase [Ferruginibacter sp.]
MKKTFAFIQYFFYLGFNWGWRIAAYVIRHEIKGESKYGIDTTGADELRKTKAGGIDISHATVYMPITYFQLDEVFETLPAHSRDHFMDIGCGKGRALCIAAYNGFNKVTGIDFSKEFCDRANKNLRITGKFFPPLKYSVVNEDAATSIIPADVDCIFLFNPFDIIIMKKVVKNIMTSIQNKPRNINIVYANPLYKQLFLEQNFIETHYSKRLNYLELSILNYRP